MGIISINGSWYLTTYDDVHSVNESYTEFRIDLYRKKYCLFSVADVGSGGRVKVDENQGHLRLMKEYKNKIIVLFVQFELTGTIAAATVEEEEEEEQVAVVEEHQIAVADLSVKTTMDTNLEAAGGVPFHIISSNEHQQGLQLFGFQNHTVLGIGRSNRPNEWGKGLEFNIPLDDRNSSIIQATVTYIRIMTNNDLVMGIIPINGSKYLTVYDDVHSVNTTYTGFRIDRFNGKYCLSYSATNSSRVNRVKVNSQGHLNLKNSSSKNKVFSVEFEPTL